MIDICWYNHCYSYNENVKSLACSGGWTPKVLKVVLFWNCSQQCPGCAKQLKYYAKISVLVYFLHKNPIYIYFEEQFWIQPVKGAGQEAKIENSWQKQKSKKHLLHHPPPPPFYPSNTFTLFRPTLFPADVQDTFQGAFHFHFPLKKTFLDCDYSWYWCRWP